MGDSKPPRPNNPPSGRRPRVSRPDPRAEPDGPQVPTDRVVVPDHLAPGFGNRPARSVTPGASPAVPTEKSAGREGAPSEEGGSSDDVASSTQPIAAFQIPDELHAALPPPGRLPSGTMPMIPSLALPGRPSSPVIATPPPSEAELVEAKARAAELEKQVAELKEQLTTTEAALQNREQTVAELRDRLEERSRTLSARIAELGTSLEAAELRSQANERLKEELEAAEARIAELEEKERNEQQANQMLLDAQHASHEAAITTLREEMKKEREAAENTLRTERNLALKRAAELDGRLNEALDELEHIRTRLEVQEEKIAADRERNPRLREEIERMRRRCNLVQDSIAAFESIERDANLARIAMIEVVRALLDNLSGIQALSPPEPEPDDLLEAEAIEAETPGDSDDTQRFRMR